jgi:hypothetical protein
MGYIQNLQDREISRSMPRFGACAVDCVTAAEIKITRESHVLRTHSKYSISLILTFPAIMIITLKVLRNVALKWSFIFTI